MSENPSAWATEILALSLKINSSSESIHTNKCSILKHLVDVTAHYAKFWIHQFGEETKTESANAVGEKLLEVTAHYVKFWIHQFGEETIPESANAVGEEKIPESANAVGEKLLGVLKRGLRLIRQCGKKEYLKSLSTIVCGAGEFCEIVDHVTRYFRMMDELIAPIVRCHPDKKQLIKELQEKVELDCRKLHDDLISAHEQDRNALINNLKSSVKDTESNFWSSSRGKRKRYILEVLIERLELERDLHPIGFTKSIAVKIGDIDLLKEATPLGTGTFGTVSKAVWGDEMPVAVKEFFYNDDFENEYNVLMKLMSTDCSHVVQILGHSSNGDGTKKTLIMELMDMDLKKLLEKQHPFSLYESTDLMFQIAKGMRGLHRVNVIHRDIKPSNILVKENTEDKSLTVKLTDFGVSKAEFQTTDPNLHTMRGTKVYMAPEMAADEGKYSKKVDVYSFGIVCTEILTGKPPNQVMQKDLKEGRMPSFLPSIPIPKDLYTMICDCLEPDKDKRPNFEEICDFLWAFMEVVLIRKDEIQWFSTEDQIRSYIDQRIELNFEMYTRTLGEESISRMPRVFTPTRKTACCFVDLNWLSKVGLQQLPVDNLVDIALYYLGIGSSGRIKLLQPWESVQNPFIAAGVQPPNLLTGNLQRDLGIFGQFKKLVVDQGKKLNLSFAIGGWNNSKYFSDAFSTDENRTRFITSVLELCRAYPIFNGLHLDWNLLSDDGVNYGKNGNTARRQDGENFILVLKQLRNALPEGFLIGVFSSTIPNWCIERAAHLIDQIQLRAVITSSRAQHELNLYSNSHQSWSVDKAITYYKSRGIDPSKIIIGPAVGYVSGFCNNDGISKPAKVGLPDDISRLCSSELVHHGFEESWDDVAKAPYAYHPQRKLFCTYHNTSSIKEKAEYIKANNLGGMYFTFTQGSPMFKVVHDHLTHG